jgi:putative protease
VVRVYRAALDYLKNLPPSLWTNPERIQMPDEFVEELLRTGTRGSSRNFMHERPGSSEMNYQTSRVVQTYEPVAVVRETGEIPLVEIRNTLLPDTDIEYMQRGIETRTMRVVTMHDDTGLQLEKANPGNRVYMTCEPPLTGVEVHGILRRRIGDNV